MRLYLKLIALVLATATLQQSLLSQDPPSEIWFGLRCSLAYAMHDDTMINRLADEARDLEFGRSLEVRLAAAGADGGQPDPAQGNLPAAGDAAVAPRRWHQGASRSVCWTLRDRAGRRCRSRRR